MFVTYLEIRLPLPLTWDELKFSQIAADQIAHRFAMKLLLEKQIDLGLRENVTITLDKLGGDFEIVAREKWLDNIFAPLNVTALKQTTDVFEYFTILIADALVYAGRFFKKDVAMIESIKTELLQEREEFKIALPFKTVSVGNCIVEPFLKIKGRFDKNTQLYVRVTDSDSQKTGTWMFIEADTPEVLSAVASFSIENGFLIAKNETNKYSLALQNRGFRFPLRAELSCILKR